MNNDISDIRFAVALSVTSGLGSLNFPWETIGDSSPEELFEMIDGKSRLTQYFIASAFPKFAIDAADAILEKVESQNIGITHYWAKSYPPILREIARPPLVLYYIGDLSADKTVAIVGTRNPSEYSKSVTKKIVERLTGDGFTIVSGMATGIDAAAHESALKSGGKTYGVLANGIGVIYPSANGHLYDLITKDSGSALISEYPPEIHAGRWTFVRRNRIISGLSRAVIAVQAGAKSGTLITARYAAEQGRDVFVCPGNAFDEDFEGSHKLIDDGARILYDLDELSTSLNASTFETQLDLFRESSAQSSFLLYAGMGTEGKILSYLARQGKPVDVDTAIRECGIAANEFQENLVILEMDGRVMRKGNTLFLG